MSHPAATAEDIFHSAIEIDDRARRDDHVHSACGDDDALRRIVEALLRAHDAAGTFMRSQSDELPGTAAATESTVAIGDSIGSYKLLQLIGEGGFGAVYLAEQSTPIRRRVALKVIKLGMDTRQVIARFEAERQALALMDHPNIARVLDAGATPTGRPYFVMELVAGEPITTFCDRHNIPIAERLDLFTQVCHAVQHAHQKGVLHRDIKPSNVLVSTPDARPLARVIDFGIAKATAAPLTEKTLFTEHRQLVGTPQYMSPEQAAGSDDIDTRTDIYSLGVLLYELLTGATPFDPRRLRSAAFAEMQRIIREDEPERPSTRLSRSADTLPSIAAVRRIEPRKLSAAIRGDLDWIVMKCLEKDRRRRYDTANDVSRDIHRHLNAEPIAARPPSPLYRASRFVRRNKTVSVASLFVALALIVGIVGASAGLLRARRAESVAARQRDELTHRVYSQSIALAQSALKDQNIATVRRYLADCPESERGWEWNHINWLADRSLVTLRGHPWQVWRVAISQDGRRAVTTGDEDRARVWSLPDGKPLTTIPTPGTWSYGIAFSPDGSRLVIGDYAGSLRVLDAATYQTLQTIKAHDYQIGNVAFSHDGRRLVSTSFDRTAKVWDWPALTPLFSVNHDERVLDADFSDDGRWLATAGADSAVNVWNAATGERRWKLTGNQWRANCVRFSPDASRLYSGHDDKIIKVWDLATGRERTTLHGHKTGVLSMCLTHDGSRLITASWDKTIRVWSLTDAASPGADSILTLTGHEDPVWSIAFTPDEQHLISTSADHTAKIWDANIGPEVAVFGGHNGGVATLTFSPDGKTIASGGADSFLHLRDAATGEESIAASAHNGPIDHIAYSPDGATIATAAEDAHICLWSADGRLRRRITGHSGPVRYIAFDAEGRTLASVGADGTLRIWDPDSAMQLASIPAHPDGAVAVRFHPTKPQLITAGIDGFIRVWDQSTLRQLRETPAADLKFRCIAISPDGKKIAAGFLVDHSIRLWDLDTGRELRRLIGHENPVSSLAFSSDGRRLLSSGHDRTVRLWNPETGQEVINLLGHEDDVWCAAFSPDGATIASAAADWSIRLWESRRPPCTWSARRDAALRFAEKASAP